MSQRILLVDDDPAAIRLMSHLLQSLGEIRFATNGQDAIRMAREFQPGVIVLDAQMPDLNGFEVCAILKSDPATADVPVIFVTSSDEADFEVSGFDAGAADYVTKPVRPAALLARVRTQLRLAEATAELRRLTHVDALTEVANRRRFDDSIVKEWRRGRRDAQPLSLILIDIDHFKRFNDHYGHPAGDACLRSIAQILRRACQRPADLVARIGGEEFALLMPQTDRHGAAHVARFIGEALEVEQIAHAMSPTRSHVTASLGLSSMDAANPHWLAWTSQPGLAPLADDGSAQALVRAADQALYAAKAAGRARAASRDLVLSMQPNDDFR